MDTNYFQTEYYFRMWIRFLHVSDWLLGTLVSSSCKILRILTAPQSNTVREFDAWTTNWCCTVVVNKTAPTAYLLGSTYVNRKFRQLCQWAAINRTYCVIIKVEIVIPDVTCMIWTTIIHALITRLFGVFSEDSFPAFINNLNSSNILNIA